MKEDLLSNLKELIDGLDYIENIVVTCRLALESSYFECYKPAENISGALYIAEANLEKAISDFSEILEKNEGASNGN